ncbi:MAG: class I SAM-dependent RNA methyltransferase [Sandaracinaceae bacterium]
MIELTVAHLNLRGDGVGIHEGRTVHVPGVFGGERAEVAVEHRSKQHPRDVGRAVSLIEAHPARRAAPCPNHDWCGGCPLMELSLPAQREQKKRMLAALGLEVTSVRGDARDEGYRWSSKRVAYAHRGRLKLGSWARGSHRGVSMRACRVDHPRIAAVFDELEGEARHRKVLPYDEASGEGALRYAWAKTDGERVLLTVYEAFEGAVDRAVLDALTLPDGVAVAVREGRGNAIRGEAPTMLRGLEALTLDGRSIGPGGFLQPNPALIAQARASLGVDGEGQPLSGALAFDLYAGDGALAESLAARFEHVEAVESDPSLTTAPRAVEPFLTQATESGAAPSLVVLNPPRKGLGPKVTTSLEALAPARIHIMSCGPEGLARDLERLSGYRLESLDAWDTLPQTPHVELVARLVRREPK